MAMAFHMQRVVVCRRQLGGFTIMVRRLSQILLIIFCFVMNHVRSFIPSETCSAYYGKMRHKSLKKRGSTNCALNGIAEWRDGLLSSPLSSQSTIISKLHLLAFPVSNVMLPGQHLTVRLKEGRFFDLLEESIEDHNSIVGMALMDDDGLLSSGCLPLCEIVAMDVNAGYRGRIDIDATLRCVGRAKLLHLDQMIPTMMGTCVEILGDEHDKLDEKDESDNDSLDAAQQVIDQIQSRLQELGTTIADRNTGGDDEAAYNYMKRYHEAHEILKSFLVSSICDYNTPHGGADGETARNNEKRERNISRHYDLQASSWAVFHCLSCFKSLPPQLISDVLSSTKLIDRLKMGIKAIVEEEKLIRTSTRNEDEGNPNVGNDTATRKFLFVNDNDSDSNGRGLLIFDEETDFQ